MEYGRGKLIPPADVLTGHFESELRTRIEETLTQQILERAGIETLVEAALQAKAAEIVRGAQDLPQAVRATLAEDEALRWTAPIEERAQALADVVELSSLG